MSNELIDDKWRFSAIRITKYDPVHRNKNGHFMADDWTSYSDIGAEYFGKKLSIEEYLEVEEKYVKAIIWFFEYHDCSQVQIVNLAKIPFEDYNFIDRELLSSVHKSLIDRSIIFLSELGHMVKLIFRGYLSFDLFCTESTSVAVRFGYDLYMYFNSPKNLDILLNRIRKEGLFTD